MENVIEIKDLRMTFGRDEVLKGITHSFEKAKIHGIVGNNGSGKTVMLAGLGDLYTYPDEEGYFLAPKNFGTAAYGAEKMERMRKGGMAYGDGRRRDAGP